MVTFQKESSMDSKGYSEKVHKFANNDFQGIAHRFSHGADFLGAIMGKVAEVLKDAETYKKIVFLGKGAKPLSEGDRLKLPQVSNENQKYLQGLHGLFGLLGEAGEVATALVERVEGGSSSALVDEVGDVLWYLNELLLSCDSSFEEAMAKNYAKLNTRYKEKQEFNASLAERKDREAEAAAQG
jgi:NTP pyrophosphatase (non-canonical NTP hydrolase)